MSIDVQKNIEYVITATDGFTPVFRGAESGLQRLEKSYSTLLTTLAGTVSVGMFVSFIKGGIEAEAQLHKLSLQTGITVETLSALRPIAKQAGTDLETVAGMVNKLEKNMLTFAQSGAGKAADAFAQLGYSQAQVKAGLQNIDAFLPEFAKRLVAAGVGGEQAGLAMQLMGKGGTQALVVMKQLAEAGPLVAKVYADQAAAAHEFEVSLVKLKSGSGQLAISLANELLPGLNAIAGAMVDAKKEGGLLAALWAGLKAYTVGTEMLQGEKDLINQTSKLFNLENQLAGVRARLGDDAPQTKLLLQRVSAIKDEIAQSRARIESLQREQEIKDKANKIGAATPLADLPTSDVNLKAYESLIKSIQEKLALDALELQSEDKLTDGQKLAVKVMTDLRDGTLKLNSAQKIKLAADLDSLITSNKSLQAAKDLAAQRAAARDAAEKDAQAAAIAQATTLTGLSDEIAKIKEHNAEIGKTREQIDRIKAAEQDRALNALRADLDIAAVEQADNGNQSAYIAFLQIQISLIREKQGLLTSGAAAEADAAATKKMAEDFKATEKEIDRGLTDALMRGFEHGKTLAYDFRDALVNMFKTMILKPVISFILSPVSGAITATLAGMDLSGTANAAGGGLNLLSSGSSLFGGGLFGSAGAYSMITGGSAAAGSQAALLAAQTGEFGAAGLAATAGASAGMASLAAAIPYVGIALAAGGLLGLFSSSSRTASPQMSGLGSLSTISQGGFSGQQWVASGSSPGDLWAGSQWGNLAADQLAAFNVAIKSVFDQMSASAKAVGIDTSALQSLTVTMGATGQGVQQDMTTALQKTADTIAETLMPNIRDLQQGSETLAQTFARVTAAQAALADQRLTMEIQLMELQGRTVEALAAKRKQELDKLDPTLRGLQQQIYAQQDLNNAANDATGAIKTLAQQISDMQKGAADAVDAQINLSQSAGQAARQAADSYRALNLSLADAVTQLRGGALSPLNPAQKYAEAGANAEAIFSQLGVDPSAAAKLQQAVTDWLNTSRAMNASSPAFTADFNRGMDMLTQAQAAVAAAATQKDDTASLLEAQTTVLENIRAILQAPAIDSPALVAQTALLGELQKALTDPSYTIPKTLMDQIKASSTDAVNIVAGLAGVIAAITSLIGLLADQAAADAAARAAAAAVTAVQTTVSQPAVETPPIPTQIVIDRTQSNAAMQAAIEAGAYLVTPGDLNYAGSPSQSYNEYVSSLIGNYESLFASGHAMGGIASGWSIFNERGPEMMDFQTPARIYTAEQTRGMFAPAANDDLRDEVKLLREELALLRGDVQNGAVMNARATAASGGQVAGAVHEVAARQEAKPVFK